MAKATSGLSDVEVIKELLELAVAYGTIVNIPDELLNPIIGKLSAPLELKK